MKKSSKMAGKDRRTCPNAEMRPDSECVHMCACTECWREMGGGGGHLMGAPTNQCKRYNSELGNSNYYTTFSVSKGVIQRKKKSQSSATSSPNDKQIDLALWLWQSKQG